MSSTLTASSSPFQEPTDISLHDSDLNVQLKFIVGNRARVCGLVLNFCATHNLASCIFSEPMSIAKSANYPKDLAVELSKYLTANNVRIQPSDGDVWGLTA